MTYQSTNPSDGKVLRTFEDLTNAQLEKSLETAETCFQTWKHTSYAERAVIVAKAAALMQEHVDDFAKLATLEMGKRIDEARGEVKFSADILAYYAKNAETFLAPTKLHPKVGEAHMESSPFGVLFCIEPWNFPYYQLARVAGPQLMAGNVVVVKHAGCVPQCAIAFEQLWIKAGAPKGAYTNLLISHEQSERVIDDPRIKGVALTGSVAAGRSVAARAGKNLKKTSMELGGSDAFIVLDDADLEKTDTMGSLGAHVQRRPNLLRGQEVHRLGLHRRQVPGAVQDRPIGLEARRPDGRKDHAWTLSTEDALVQLLKQVDNAVAKGAKLVMGGKRIERPGVLHGNNDPDGHQARTIRPFATSSSDRSCCSFASRTRRRPLHLPMTRTLVWVDRSSPKISRAESVSPVKSTRA